MSQGGAAEGSSPWLVPGVAGSASELTGSSFAAGAASMMAASARAESDEALLRIVLH
jgi:hypothetical protein